MRWARVVGDLLRPGGFLYLSEFHPFADILGDDDLTVEHSYFARTRSIGTSPARTPTSTPPTVHNVTYEWMHPLWPTW